MHQPARIRMSESDEREFNKLVPPPVLHMTDEGLNGSWLQTNEESAVLKSEFEANPLIIKIKQNPENTELLFELMKETESRCKKHAVGCCLSAIKPCKFGLLSFASAVGAYREAKQGKVCTNTFIPFCCLFTCGTLTRCFTSYKEIKAYSKKLHKTCAVRNMFFDVLMKNTDINAQKKTQ